MLTRFLFIFALLFATPIHAAQTILVFGDSLSAGYGLPQNTGWVSLLEQKLKLNKLNYKVVNTSISGETTTGGLYRIEKTLALHKPKIAIIELGANDGLRGLSLQATKNNLEGILRACKQQKADILIIGMRLPPNYGRAYAEKFHNIFLEVAQHSKSSLVPFLLDGFADHRELFQSDGLHPTVEAQQLILNNVWRKLQPMLAE
ncbi:arylesterase [Sulfurirhabdus autotrophica]|uniref:Acyl-CoA thioesterase-1 n=1 Tax=Sulfurirhabdus autotrophica TaxID=1706046 RepID=A0A4V2W359_9PROT|nr:arylesterase [Sulfurirhabdus autotrophica]TCV90699.1 acyl-CoA thioesterase-1 [Sulfurirhabdus autotrophica]